MVEVSARHVHVTEKTLETLFGAGHKLTNKKDLSQPGQFACEEKVTVVGEKGSLKAHDILKAQGVSARVINMATVKPLDDAAVLAAAKDTGAIVTAEEHSVIGGLGSAVAELVCENCPVPVVKVGVYDRFGYSGPAAKLLDEFGLRAENIAEKAKAAIALKK